MASVDIDAIIAIKNVAFRFLTTIGTCDPLRYYWRWIAGIVDKKGIVERPIEMHAVTTIDDCRWLWH